MGLREVLNDYLDFDLIEINFNKKLPPFPFATFQVIDEDRDKYGNVSSSLEENDIIKKTKHRRVKKIVQIDVYGESYSSVYNAVNKIIDVIDFEKENELEEAGYFITFEGQGNIKDNTSLEKTFTRYRKTFTFRYAEYGKTEQLIENGNAVEFDNELIER